MAHLVLINIYFLKFTYFDAEIDAFAAFLAFLASATAFLAAIVAFLAAAAAFLASFTAFAFAAAFLAGDADLDFESFLYAA